MVRNTTSNTHCSSPGAWHGRSGPRAVFAAGEVSACRPGTPASIAIARDLRATDVHPPLYFWAVALWRRLIGGGLLAVRLFSRAVWVGGARGGGGDCPVDRVPGAALAMLLTLGCYGFAYTGAIARGFALAQALTLWGVAVLLASDGAAGPGVGRRDAAGSRDVRELSRGVRSLNLSSAARGIHLSRRAGEVEAAKRRG